MSDQPVRLPYSAPKEPLVISGLAWALLVSLDHVTSDGMMVLPFAS